MEENHHATMGVKTYVVALNKRERAFRSLAAQASERIEPVWPLNDESTACVMLCSV